MEEAPHILRSRKDILVLIYQNSNFYDGILQSCKIFTMLFSIRKLIAYLTIRTKSMHSFSYKIIQLETASLQA